MKETVNNIKNRFLLFFILSLLILISGCASITSSNADEMARFNNLQLSNSCDFKFIDKKMKSSDDPILWGIQGGSLARNCGEFKKSIAYFDEAEYRYKYDVDLKNPIISAGHKATSLLANSNSNPYEGNIYEKIMVNTYKGLDFLALGDKENARVEFNRALERQIIAKEYFNKEIASQIKKNNKDIQDLIKEQNSYNDLRTSEAMAYQQQTGIRVNPQTLNYNTQLQNSLIKNNSKNNPASAYPDFVNPFTTYISALFFLLDGSYERAYSLFREGLQMDPKNQQIIKDITLAQNYANAPHLANREKYVWLIYEAGLGAEIIESRVDLPIFVLSNSLYYTGIALPKLRFRQSSYRYLSIKNGLGDNSRTSLIANMDSIVSAEFDKRFSLVVTQALLSAALKTIIQKELNSHNEIAGILAALYQGASTRADIRSWSALPKSFQIASIAIKDGNITILNENGVILVQEFIPNNKHAIFYIKSSHVNQVIVHKILF